MSVRKRIAAFVAATVSVIAATVLFTAQPAMAASVNGYGGAGLVITVNTGSKNYGNHTQYVSSIYVLDTAGQICDNLDLTEAWAGSVWYAQTRYCPRGVLFTVDRWVPSGSGVCGSYWRWMPFKDYPWTDTYYRRFRFVACITISV